MYRNKNKLRKYFLRNKGSLIHKWHHYFDIYDHHFARFRGKKVSILEMGVSHGGSLEMWRDYFGRKAYIVGIDINPQCKRLEKSDISIEIGSQEDVQFLRKVVTDHGPFDIIIDDGGHTVRQ